MKGMHNSLIAFLGGRAGAPIEKKIELIAPQRPRSRQAPCATSQACSCSIAVAWWVT